LKKGFLAGLGATIATKESIERSLDEFVQKGKMTQDEAKSVADKVVEDSKKEFEQSKSQLCDFFEEMQRKANFATETHVQRLEARISRLEKEMATLQESTSKPSTPSSSVPVTKPNPRH